MKNIRRSPDKAYLDTNLWIPKNSINVDGTKNALTFEFFEDRESKLLRMWKEEQDHLVVPREFYEYESHFNYDIVDCRPPKYESVVIRDRIQLDHEIKGGKVVPTGRTTQRDALDAMLKARGGILQLGCGKGKTVIFLKLAATLRVPTLIVIDNVQLLTQWAESISRFLDVPGGVGLIQAEAFDWKRPIVLATYHTLANRAAVLPEEVRRWFGLIGWDEAHHVNAPTFSKSADLFYGRRYGLTATPQRDDGLHIVHEFHIGRTLYRDLSQDLKPRIYFMWTGLSPDTTKPEVAEAIYTRGGELSLGKLAVYYGQWLPRLDFILNEVRKMLDENRKVLVLSNSVDELVNLLARWNQASSLYTDVAMPTPADVGETLDPEFLTTDEVETLKNNIKRWEEQKNKSNDLQKKQLQELIDETSLCLERVRVAGKIEALLRKRQKEYRTSLLAMPSDAGLMIHKVPSKDRMRMLREKRVTFAIMKYGKEGLDEQSLDSVLMCEPVGSRNTLQQIIGRPTRKLEGKKTPIIVVLEDDVGPIIGMCQKMRKHLMHWPVSDGGPFTYEFVGYPAKKKGKR